MKYPVFQIYFFSAEQDSNMCDILVTSEKFKLFKPLISTKYGNSENRENALPIILAFPTISIFNGIKWYVAIWFIRCFNEPICDTNWPVFFCYHCSPCMLSTSLVLLKVKSHPLILPVYILSFSGAVLGWLVWFSLVLSLEGGTRCYLSHCH